MTEDRRMRWNRGSLACDVVRTVAAVRGVPPATLEHRLYDAVDADALERLFAARPDGSARRPGRASFVLAECRVVVEADGGVVAYRLDE
ncbi:HalOD1 output domain-containing protein [Halomarina ordinaria]|uniref:HalOD1 output domain-containing protein n=1 Tax=Halomarina ordinaria TaxID=3033939 RepID=A0ABD5UBD0_9EURY|nr:HalOD1 output domain-containing protein [Halomarina sp. PSRA2]